MDKIGSIAKGGWHPERTGSIRGDIKAMVGRGGENLSVARERAVLRNTTPLSALKDPSTFAPPPKHAAYYGEGSSDSPTTSSTSTSGPAPLPPRSGSVSASREQRDSEEVEAPPAGPFRVDTTGLSTANLPKPPVRRLGSPATGSTTPPQVTRAATLPASTSTTAASAAKAKKPGPPLPPRLPPRDAVAASKPNVPASPPPSYAQATTSKLLSKPRTHGDAGDQLLNRGAINRLGAAGISVPGFHIGAPSNTTESSSVPLKAPQQTKANVSELQSRFAALGSAVNSRVAEGHGPGGPPIGKKPALPPKKNTSPIAAVDTVPTSQDDDERKPPPIPLSTKPR